jgi:NADPH:quinone reductase
MRAAVVKEFGPILSHALDVLPDAAPTQGEVLVTIKATAVNYVDSLVVTGKYQFRPDRPFTPGKLPAGVVSALGAGVTDLEVGDRVLALAEQGGYAELIVVAAHQCFKLPTTMSFIDAASMALVYDTSWFALRERARFCEGESVLVLGSTGGVGLASVQLAKALGGKVLAGVSNAAKSALAFAAGADAVIDLSKDNEVSGLQVSDYRKRTPFLMDRCMREIFALFEAGKLKPAPSVIRPLEDFAQALQDVVDRRVNGRIVLVPNP